MEAGSRSPDWLWGCGAFVLLLSWSIPIANKINEIQPEPYLDEVFHIPQSLAYYRANYSHWDDKITTLPGLYCFANLILQFEQLFGIVSNGDPSTAAFRFVNIIINCSNFWLLYVLLGVRENDDSMSDKRRAFATLTLSLFPLHYFFSFLYYTDPISTFFVLHMAICTKTSRHKMSALSGLCAVLTRQTNIIWIFWNITVALWEIGKIFVPEIERSISSLFPSPPLPPLKGKRPPKAPKQPMLPATTKEDLLRLWFLCCKVAVPTIYPQAIVLGLFALFVYVNGSIVVGDKSAHRATINIPQIFYFSLFYGFFTAGGVLLNLRRLLSTLREYFKLLVVLTLCGLVIVAFNTQVHPYLLADNRHYPFYVWKRVYQWFPIVKYALVPIYVSLIVHMCLDSMLHPALTFGTFIFIAGALIPQLLLEFRYFIIPYFILRLSSSSLQWKHLIPECLLYLIINSVTLSLFLYKPFVWSHTNETQRFMW